MNYCNWGLGLTYRSASTAVQTPRTFSDEQLVLFLGRDSLLGLAPCPHTPINNVLGEHNL